MKAKQGRIKTFSSTWYPLHLHIHLDPTPTWHQTLYTHNRKWFNRFKNASLLHIGLKIICFCHDCFKNSICILCPLTIFCKRKMCRYQFRLSQMLLVSIWFFSSRSTICCSLHQITSCGKAYFYWSISIITTVHCKPDSILYLRRHL
jgi:hypothetical protein